MSRNTNRIPASEGPARGEEGEDTGRRMSPWTGTELEQPKLADCGLVGHASTTRSTSHVAGLQLAPSLLPGVHSEGQEPRNVTFLVLEHTGPSLDREPQACRLWAGGPGEPPVEYLGWSGVPLGREGRSRLESQASPATHMARSQAGSRHVSHGPGTRQRSCEAGRIPRMSPGYHLQA